MDDTAAVADLGRIFRDFLGVSDETNPQGRQTAEPETDPVLAEWLALFKK
jgi:hypothetical protein